jgi:hypothetical protein
MDARIFEKLIPATMTEETLIRFQDPLWGILLRLAINLVVLYIIIYLIYAQHAKKKDKMFPFFLMGIMLFLICTLLKKVEMNMGMALGLFAVFSIMRFRTENLVAKDMAYLFTVIGISVINAMFDFPHPVRGTILINVILILTVFILEFYLSKYSKEEDNKAEKKALKLKKAEGKPNNKAQKKKFNKHQVLYDKLELLNPNKTKALIKDISARTGIKIEKIEIRKIDLVKGNADLDVFYRCEKSGPEVE